MEIGRGIYQHFGKQNFAWIKLSTIVMWIEFSDPIHELASHKVKNHLKIKFK